MGCNVSRSAPFGGDLTVQWAKSPEIPTILILCGKFLEVRPASIERGLFRTPSSRYVDSKPTEPGVLSNLQQNPSYEPRIRDIKRFRSLANIHRLAAVPWTTINGMLFFEMIVFIKYFISSNLINFFLGTLFLLLFFIKHRSTCCCWFI